MKSGLILFELFKLISLCLGLSLSKATVVLKNSTTSKSNDSRPWDWCGKQDPCIHLDECFIRDCEVKAGNNLSNIHCGTDTWVNSCWVYTDERHDPDVIANLRKGKTWDCVNMIGSVQMNRIAMSLQEVRRDWLGVELVAFGLILAGAIKQIHNKD
ncbi:hypothetical protein ACJ72_06275 [Emergomyces africanus]|uniref:Extracellular membrane protein CFEM domain-containing protein n=1 Tax=Emergomyces africanus TaxID=1955775 RepID=A0A1B7NRH9_9EURO|nr:hypothetical protein ACJ72_06275 [Emergomyces africanus]